MIADASQAATTRGLTLPSACTHLVWSTWRLEGRNRYSSCIVSEGTYYVVDLEHGIAPIGSSKVEFVERNRLDPKSRQWYEWVAAYPETATGVMQYGDNVMDITMACHGGCVGYQWPQPTWFMWSAESLDAWRLVHFRFTSPGNSHYVINSEQEGELLDDLREDGRGGYIAVGPDAAILGSRTGVGSVEVRVEAWSQEPPGPQAGTLRCSSPSSRQPAGP